MAEIFQDSDVIFQDSDITWANRITPGECIVKAQRHGFSINQAVAFSTAGTLPSGLFSSTAYYIISDGFTADQFKISATLGGTAVSISDAGTGNMFVSICLDPQVILSWSDDGGFTWSNDYPASMGKLGNYKTRAYWNRLGYAKDRVFRVTMAHPVRKVITGAMAE